MRVLIAAGGTAGHINPALAIAGALKKRHPDAEIHFAGRQKGMEYGLVSKAGYAFHPIEVNGIQRRLTPKNIARNLVALWHLALSGPRAGAILREVKPDLVIGAGGYVSGPVVQAAARRGIRTAIHEQNAFPGVTNKILAKQVDLVFAAMPDAVQDGRYGQPGAGGDVPAGPSRRTPRAGREGGAGRHHLLRRQPGRAGAGRTRGRFGKMGDRAA